MKFILSIILIGVYLSSCASSNRGGYYTPSWYLNPPQNDNSYLYGVGEGKNFSEAKSRALKVMSASLNVYVNFIINKHIIKTQNGLKSTYSNDIKNNVETKTKQIVFSNVKVVKKLHTKSGYYVLLKTNKQLLAKHKKDDFLYAHLKILNALKATKEKSKLKQLYTISPIKKQIKKAKKLAAIAYAADNNFDYKKYFFFYQEVSKNATLMQKSLKIKIKIDDKFKIIKDELSIFVNSNSYSLVDGNDYDMLINVRVFDSSIKDGRWHISKLNINMNFKDEDGVTISSKKIRVGAKSLSGKNSSLMYASRKFGDKLRKIGIKKLLFNM